MAGPLTVRLRPSLLLQASVLAVHGAAALALFHAVRDPLLMIPCELAVLLSAVLGVVGEVRKRGLTLVLHEDGGAVVHRTAAAPCAARVRPGAVLFRAVIWIEFDLLQPGRRRRLNLMLVSSNVMAGQWRVLRVWLHHRALRLAAVSS